MTDEPTADPELEGILAFLRTAERLKSTPRSGWTTAGERESVAAHTWRLSLMAAVLSDRVKQVTLKHPLSSYAEVAETSDYRWPLAALVPRVLTRFDLPDCYQALSSKQLQLIEPVGAAGVPA